MTVIVGAVGVPVAQTMTVIGYVAGGLPCGPAVRTLGGIKFCAITKEQADKVTYCTVDQPLARGAWARLAT